MKIITDQPIDIPKLISDAHSEKTGAIVLFSGEARNHHQGREVIYLEYSAHETMAEKVIQDLCQKAVSKWSLHKAYCVHRIGRVNPGESSVVIITTSSHRDDAYQANQFIINELKKDAPIWKKEFYKDGTSEWGA